MLERPRRRRPTFSHSDRDTMIGLVETARKKFSEAERSEDVNDKLNGYLDAARLFADATKVTEDEACVHSLLYLSNLAANYANSVLKLQKAQKGLLRLHQSDGPKENGQLALLSERIILAARVSRLNSISKIPRQIEPAEEDVVRDARTMNSKLEEMGISRPVISRGSSVETEVGSVRSQMMDESFLLLPQHGSMQSQQLPPRPAGPSGKSIGESSMDYSLLSGDRWEAAAAAPSQPPKPAATLATDWTSYLAKGWVAATAPVQLLSRETPQPQSAPHPSSQFSGSESSSALRWNDQSTFLPGAPPTSMDASSTQTAALLSARLTSASPSSVISAPSSSPSADASGLKKSLAKSTEASSQERKYIEFIRTLQAEKALLQSDNKSLAQKVQTLQNEVTQLQIRSPTQDQAPKQAPFNAEAEIQSLKQNVEYLERLLNGLVGKYYASKDEGMRRAALIKVCLKMLSSISEEQKQSLAGFLPSGFDMANLLQSLTEAKDLGEKELAERRASEEGVANGKGKGGFPPPFPSVSGASASPGSTSAAGGKESAATARRPMFQISQVGAPRSDGGATSIRSQGALPPSSRNRSGAASVHKHHSTSTLEVLQRPNGVAASTIKPGR